MGKGFDSTVTTTKSTEVQSPVLDLQSEDFATNLVNVINSSIEKRFSALEENLNHLTRILLKLMKD